MNILNLLNKGMITFILIFTPYLINYVVNIKHEDYLVFLNIGQGDSTLICTRYNNCGLIDTGKQNIITKAIRSYTNNPLEFILLTHPDADHTAKTLEILNEIGSKQVFLGKTSKASDLTKEIANMNIPVYELRSNNDFTFGDYSFDILWPNLDINVDTLESNETSTSIKLTNKNKNFYLAGDLGTEYEEFVQGENSLENITIAKFSHHGSKNSSSKHFLEKLSPELGIISVGKNSYGHPSKELLQRIEDLNLNYLRTDQDGDIKISIFEEKLGITTQISKKSYIILN